MKEPSIGFTLLTGAGAAGVAGAAAAVESAVNDVGLEKPGSPLLAGTGEP